MPAPPLRRHRLAGGLVEVAGDGPTGTLIERHLGPAVDARDVREVLVRVDLVDDLGPTPPGLRIRSRRGDASVRDGAPVAVAWARRSTTARPLVAAAHLAARRRGALLMHGAALSWGNAGAVLVTGPSGAGKTGVLLAAIASGATALAPDWSWVDAGSGALWPLPQPVRLRPHHLRSPIARAAVPAARRVLLLAAGRTGVAARRAHADVPLETLNPRPAGAIPPSVLRAVVVLGHGSGDDGAVTLTEFTGDGIAGTSSPDLLEELARTVEVRPHATGRPDDAAGLAHRLAA